MSREIYRYTFDDKVPFSEIEESMLLATLAVESLHGRSSIRLDAAFTLDSEKRTAAVDACTDVGRDIARVFTCFVTKQFGEELFKVERVLDQSGTLSENGSSRAEVETSCRP
jgi:hypothetical protein